MRNDVRTLAALLAMLTLGCATGPEPAATPESPPAPIEGTADRAEERSEEKWVSQTARAPPASAADPLARPEHDPEAAHRARGFYLQGVKLLHDPSRVDEAIREFQLALQHDTLFHKAHFKLGICYYHKGQYDLEIAEYRKCLAIVPQYVPAQLNLGHAYLARDMLEEAREAYQQVLAQEPNNAVALYNLGLVEYDLREFARSYDYLDRFLRVHQDDGRMGERARMYLEEIRLKRGDRKGS